MKKQDSEYLKGLENQLSNQLTTVKEAKSPV